MNRKSVELLSDAIRSCASRRPCPRCCGIVTPWIAGQSGWWRNSLYDIGGTARKAVGQGFRAACRFDHFEGKRERVSIKFRIKQNHQLGQRLFTLLCACLLLSSCQTLKGERVAYTSANVETEYWAYSKPVKTEFPFKLSGHLFLPEGPGPHPVVVWGSPTTHMSPNLSQWRHDLRSGLLERGIGIVFNDSYTGRGFAGKVTNKRLNSASRYFDNTRLLGALAAHPRIDPARIGIAGASYGANIAQRLNWEYYMNKTRPDGLRYAAHVAIYPLCSQKILDYESTGAPMLIFIGKEDYNDATRCHDRVRELKAAGTQVELIEYPATYHCYLSSSSVKLVNTPVYRRCGIQVLKSLFLKSRVVSRCGTLSGD